MTQNNKKQVYLAPAVEANVVKVENGFSMSNCFNDQTNIEALVTGSTITM